MKREIPPLHSPADDGADWARPLAFAEQACCCPGTPVVTVVMPPAHGRPRPMDRLLGGHHYRVSEMACWPRGVTVYEETGMVLPAEPEPGLALANMTAAREGAHA